MISFSSAHIPVASLVAGRRDCIAVASVADRRDSIAVASVAHTSWGVAHTSWEEDHMVDKRVRTLLDILVVGNRCSFHDSSYI